MTAGGFLPPVVNPPVIEIDDQHYAFSSSRADSLYDAFGPPTTEVEKKVCAIEEKLKAMESSNAIVVTQILTTQSFYFSPSRSQYLVLYLFRF